MRVFLDANILLDVIELRTEFVEESSAVLALSEQTNAELFIAWHTLATIYYLIRRRRTEQETMQEIDRILDWARIAPVDYGAAVRARNLGFTDFEDAMQCVCAENCQADIIVTRNTKDFASSPISVLSPGAFIRRCKEI
jgi:predicted nucleic acid-binding protein